MALRIRRGLETDRSSVTPDEGEFLYVTDTGLLYIGDGSTAGGNVVAGGGGGGIESATASGTDTYTATISGVASYATHDIYEIIFTNANTGSSTININSLGAKTLKKSVSTNLASGDILAGQSFIIVYDGTNFQVIGIGGGGGSTWGSITGTLSSQTDLQTALDLKADFAARVQTVTTASSVTPDIDSYDVIEVTALDQPLTVNNPTGTPLNIQSLIIKIFDDGTSRTVTFGSAYNANGSSLPTDTVIGETLYVPFLYNSDTLEWDYIGSAGGGSGSVNSGTQYRIGYYATTGTAISEASAITASRALKSDANGVPTHFDTATEPSLTELTYVKGVNNPIQSQINSLGSGARLYLFNAY